MVGRLREELRVVSARLDAALEDLHRAIGEANPGAAVEAALDGAAARVEQLTAALRGLVPPVPPAQ